MFSTLFSRQTGHLNVSPVNCSILGWSFSSWYTVNRSTIPPTVTDVTERGLSVCTYVSVVYSCILHAKAVGWNEMPFDSDTCVVYSNTVLDGAPVPARNEGICGRNPPVSSDAAHRPLLTLPMMPVQLHVSKTTDKI